MRIVDGLLDLLEILVTNKTKGKPNQLELLQVINQLISQAILGTHN